MGRKTKLNPQIQEAIVTRLKTGATIKATCDSVGLGETTYHQWVAVGNAYLEGEKHAKMPRLVVEREALAEFAEQTTRARSDGMIHAAARFREGMNPSESVTEHTETTTETRLRTVKREDGATEQVPYEHIKETTKRIVSHQPGDWRAAMEYLARRDPAEWARQKLEIKVETWQDEYIKHIKAGEIEYMELERAFDSDLATELFRLAGVEVTADTS